MGIRLAKETEFPQILEIIDYAKQTLKEEGIDQWQNGYPNLQVIQDDYEKKQLYVYVEEETQNKNETNQKTNETIVAFCVVALNKKPIYETGLDGQWGYEGKYAAIHRVAVSKNAKRKGYAHEIMKFAYDIAKENKCVSLRVDTHKDNIKMTKVIEKAGYTFRGILTYDDKATVFRNAYDLPVKY